MRKIIHIDMDCFYAAVEMRDNPVYRNIPLAIGGTGPRSVLSTCNYQARQFGVRSAMPSAQAIKLCPQLLIVPGRMSEYKAVSQQIRKIFHQYTDLVEPLSLDEAYLDVSDCNQFDGSATLIAKAIRQQIESELHLTASAGIAPNKFLAKIASDENKPNGQFVITPAKVAEFVANLDLKKIPGVGPKTYQRLNAKGLYTCADVRALSLHELELEYGKWGKVLYQRARGIDDREVETSRIRKSLAIETTLAQDILTLQQCSEVIEVLYPRLIQRLSKLDDKPVKKLGIKLKFSDFSQTTVEQTSDNIAVSQFLALLTTAIARGQGKSIRLVGLMLGFDPVSNSTTPQMDFGF